MTKIKYETKFVETITVNLETIFDDIIDDVIEQLKDQHFKDVCWEGDRGGQYIVGHKYVVKDKKPENYVINISPLVVYSKVFED